MAFLLLLERLSPVERAVFLLHDVLGYGYDEVAAIVGKSADNCRQLALRSRRHVAESKPRFETSRVKREELASRFFAAVGGGDIDGLVSLLAEDARVYGDSGGVRPSWPSRSSAATTWRLMAAVDQVRQRAARAARRDQRPAGCDLAWTGRRMINVFSSTSPTADQTSGLSSTVKLAHLGPLADLDDLRRQLG